MDESDFEQALADVNARAKVEYHLSLVQMAHSNDPERATLQIGRLIGVMLKEPFASSHAREVPSSVTGAMLDWQLQPDLNFDDQNLQTTWQYQTLDAIVKDPSLPADSGLWTPGSVQALVLHAQYERGFFGYLGRSLSKYICQDPQFRRQLSQRVNAARRAGFPFSDLSPGTMAAGVAFGVAGLLTANVPVLGFAGATLIAALTWMILQIGIDAFCEWLHDSYGEVRRTDEVEKH